MNKIYDHQKLFERSVKNPILTAAEWPYPIHSIFNAGATRLESGETLLLCRVEDHRGISHFCTAISKNGVDNWQIDSKPTLLPDADKYPEEVWGIEDPRITWIPDLQKFAVVYTSFSRGGPGVSLALTKDFKNYERLGVVMPPEDKDAALLPVKIKGYWAMIHRPMTPRGAHVWMSYSPDLIHWGKHRLVLQARRGGWWDANKIGLCCPLIETQKGWIMIYHGVRQTASGCIYRLGLALMDKLNPEQCLLRGEPWVFGPEETYEREGDVDNVVFPCGYVLGDDGDTIRLYYGAADTCMALATSKVSYLLAWLEKNGQPENYPQL